MTLRTRIKKDMIYCLPWKIWEYEIRLLPISAKTLFAKKGISIDKLEEELKLEGWLHHTETLLEHLKIENNLTRKLYQTEVEGDTNLGNFPDDWGEDDFIYNGFGVNN